MKTMNMVKNRWYFTTLLSFTYRCGSLFILSKNGAIITIGYTNQLK